MDKQTRQAVRARRPRQDAGQPDAWLGKQILAERRRARIAKTKTTKTRHAKRR